MGPREGKRDSRNRPWRKLGISKGRYLKEDQVERETALMAALILLGVEISLKGSGGNKKRELFIQKVVPLNS